MTRTPSEWRPSCEPEWLLKTRPPHAETILLIQTWVGLQACRAVRRRHGR